MRSTTTKPSLSGLIESTNIPASLVRAVVRQMGGWETFVQNAPDICRGGIDGGFNGFIYNADTEPFARRNRRDIASMAEEQAKEFGMEVSAMIRGFGCFKGQDITSSEVGRALYAGENMPDGVNMLNALAWYAGEEVSRAYCDAFDPQ